MDVFIIEAVQPVEDMTRYDRRISLDEPNTSLDMSHGNLCNSAREVAVFKNQLLLGFQGVNR